MPNKPTLLKQCPQCKVHFYTTNPKKIFHSTRCRVDYWQKHNPRVKVELTKVQEKINKGQVS